jgi:predicted esterase
MAVFLHGDVSRGGSSDYMLSSAQRFVKDVPGAQAVVLIRPGYYDRDKRMSEGSDCGRRDCYTAGVVATVADAVAQLKERFGAKTVLGFGHSGGSAILASLLGRRPRLMAGAVLTSCPCDIRSWKPGWTSSISPLDTVREVANTAKIIAVTGSDDDNTAPAIAQRYVDALKSAGKDAAFIRTDGTHDYRSVRSAGLEALQRLALR